MTIFVLVPAAPYEIYFIFPINDRILKMDQRIEQDGEDLTEPQIKELASLLDKWAYRNLVRVALPFVAGVVGICNLIIFR